MYIRKRTYFIIAFILALFSATASGEIFQGMQNKWKIGPEYKIDYIIKPSSESGKGELDLRLSIPYDEILFVKKGANFKGRFDISIMIFEEDEQRISESWIEKLSLNEFKITNSRKRAFNIQRNYQLTPGKYRLEVLVTDLKTQNRRKQVKEIDMSHLNVGPWMLGDLYILEDRIIEGKNSDMPDAVYVGFVASGVKGEHTFTYTLFSGDKPIKQGKFNVVLKAEKHEYCFPVRTSDLNYNKYLLVLKTHIDDQEYQRKIPFRIKWGEMSILVPNLPDAIEQMRYLSHTGYFPLRTYKKLQNAGAEEQKDFFTETWKKIDPTPDTERNELMNEYYYRVHIANQRFSGHREGWRSDPGMVYIIYGEPDAIEEHHMEIDRKPYMIWYYYTVNRKFMFVDYTGFGDYQLSEPLSEY